MKFSLSNSLDEDLGTVYVTTFIGLRRIGTRIRRSSCWLLGFCIMKCYSGKKPDDATKIIEIKIIIITILLATKVI